MYVQSFFGVTYRDLESQRGEWMVKITKEVESKRQKFISIQVPLCTTDRLNVNSHYLNGQNH